MTFTLALLDHPAPRLLDEDGRPVAEVGSEVEGTVPTVHVACPYADRRRGMPMNRSALRQLGAVWPEVLARLSAYAGPPPVTVHAALGAVLAGTSTVVRWWCDHPDLPVPRGLAATYKTSLGLSQVLAASCLLEPDLGPAPLRSLGDADAFFSFLDDGGWLLGQVEACAGPRGAIGEAFDALCAGGGPTPPWAPDVRWGIGLLGASLLAAPTADPASAPRLARLLGPKGPSWTRALFGAPGRSPAHVARWFAPDDPVRSAVESFAGEVRGRSSAEVERFVAEALAQGLHPS